MTWTWQMTYAVAGPAFVLVGALCVWAMDTLTDWLDARRERSFQRFILKPDPARKRLSPEEAAALERAIHDAIANVELPRGGPVSGAT